MPTRDSAIPGAPCWIELFSSDLDRNRSFYEQLFGWTSEAAGEELGGYVTFSKDGVAVAGAMANDGQSGYPDTWTVYLASEDTETTLKSASNSGGQVLLGPMQIADIGHMGVVADPGGAAIGVWQPGTFHGFGVVDEPNAPGWFELFTRDFDAAVGFYREVFGWDTREMGDSDDFRYTVLQHGDAQLAGIMDAGGFLPEGTPAQWSIYFRVADADATLARVEELGGSIVQPAEDTTYGRLAQATDPVGTRFKLIG